MEKGKNLSSFLKWSAVLVGAYLFFRFVVPLILPFIASFFIALLLQAPIKILHKRMGVSRKVISAVLMIVVIAGGCVLVFLACNRLLSEVGKFVVSFNENSDMYIGGFFEYINGISQKLPFIEALGGDFSVMITDSVDGILSSTVSKIPMMVASIVSALPQVLLFTVVLIISSYYFCSDYEKITERIYSILPPVYRNSAENFRNKLMATGISYVKASLVLAFITFVETWIGFLMLQIEYSFTLAIIVAAIDFLPVLGAGTILLPWSAFLFIRGDSYTAIGLLLVFAVVTLVRRMAEPRIISYGIGLPPILTLLAMYVGFQLFGLSGLFFAPILAVVFVHMLPDEIAQKIGVKTEKNSKKVGYT